jgi:hypothetical protein
VIGSILIILRLFHAFAGETLVATVTTRRLSPEEFELTYTIPAAQLPPGVAAKPPSSATQLVRLRGDQWAISGGIVKWHPILAAFGLKSYHKPMRLNGQFSDLRRQRSHLPTICALEPAVDWFWQGLYWSDQRLPFVEAVYGSSAYVYVEPQSVQEVYVTPSGYMIKRKKRL